MNIRKILCPIDFSAFSDKASAFASIFAKASGAEIIYLHVADQTSGNDYAYAIERIRENAIDRLSKIEPTIDGIKFSHAALVCSMIADTIVEYADEHDVDLIVIPTHGRTGLRRLLHGSVAEAVLRKSKCVVATVRPDSKFFEQVSEVDSTAKSECDIAKNQGVL